MSSYWTESGEIKEMYFAKADETDPHRKMVEPCQLNIKMPLPVFEDNPDGWREAKKKYQHDAKYLAEALFKSLPQGTLDRLVVELLKSRVSLFRGVAGS